MRCNALHAFQAEFDRLAVQTLQIIKPRAQWRRGLGNLVVLHESHH
ncbi:hypothetical protein AXX16_1944 [Serratia rubidaea]|nr:hypothetical protein AXX16_1944 [Serratia rubidaea]